MISARSGAFQALRLFLTAETGTVSVDWAVLSASVATMSLAAAGALYVGTTTFENGVERTLKENVSNVQATSAGVVRGVGVSSTGEEAPFGFSAVSSSFSSTTSRVTCDMFVTDCGVSEDTVIHRFLMNDGTVWTRTTTSFPDGADDQIMWLDDQGRPATEIPELPSDLPVITM